MKRLAFVGLAVALASSPAAAQTLLFDNFNNENGGVTQLNYNGFANWTVLGQVDYVNNFGGISCVGVPSGCVDLDGSSGPGSMTTIQSFSFVSGDVVKISFDIGGSQRSSAPDVFLFDLYFGVNTPIASFFGGGGLSFFTGGPMVVSGLGAFPTIVGTTPFSTWSFQFEAAGAGSVQYSFGTLSADNVGPLLDNVLIERLAPRTVVPEPSTWAMLAFGMSAMGIAARRRTRKV